MMIYFLMFFWFTGYMFATGLCFDNTKGKEGALVALAMLFVWPLILGCEIRKKCEWRDS